MAIALSLPSLGLAETLASIRIARRSPDDHAWAGARDALERTKRPGDVVVVAPRWAEPHARAALGDAFFPIEATARADETRVLRVLELGALAARSPDHVGWPEREEHALPDGLTLRVLENPRPVVVVADLLAFAARGDMHVARVVAGQRYPCLYTEQARVVAPGLFGHPALPARRFVCGDDASGVAVTVQDDESFRPRRCLFVPTPDGGSISVQFSDLPLGRVLRGHGGVFWTQQREQKGAAVELTFRLDGTLLGTVRHREGDGFVPFELPLGARAHTTASLEVDIRAVDGSARPFCFEADTRE